MGRHEQHGVVAQARAQTIDQRHLRSVDFIAGQQTEIAAGERQRLFALENNRFDRRRQRNAREPLAQNTDEMRRRSSGRAKRERHMRRRYAALPQIMLVRQRKR